VGGDKARPKMPSFFLGKIIFIEMVNYENAMKYINKQETTDISYVKIGNDNKKLIVSFTGNGNPYFQRKTSLMKLKYKRNDFDVLYLRNEDKWYLGGLNGIGKNINHTIAFLKKEFTKYDKVLCIGISAGGYASLLFGSLLNVNCVAATVAQTDLQYCVDNLPDKLSEKQNLINRSKQCPATWSKYNKIVNVLNDVVSYNVYYKGDDVCKKPRDFVLHGDYHYDQIKDFPTVSKLDSKNMFQPIEEFLEETS
jgi:hypothetical protein